MAKLHRYCETRGENINVNRLLLNHLVVLVKLLKATGFLIKVCSSFFFFFFLKHGHYFDGLSEVLLNNTVSGLSAFADRHINDSSETSKLHGTLRVAEAEGE